MTEPAGRNIELGPLLWVNQLGGEISTTDSNGQPTCLTGWISTITTPIGAYTGRLETRHGTNTLSTTSTVVVDGKTTTIATTFVSVNPVELWLMPDLTDLIPGIAAVEQCKTIIPGGSPVALTRANEIVLPARTLPLTPDTASSTTASRSSSTRTIARPGSSHVVALPANTADTQTSTTIIAPTRPGTKPDLSGQETHRPEPAGNTNTRPTNKPQDFPPSRGSIATTRSIDVVPIVPVHAPDNAPVSSRVTTIHGTGSIRKAADNPDVYDVGTGIRLTVGGPAATITGAVYTALPSGNGVLAIANGKSTTITTFANAAAQIETTAGAEDKYIIGEGTTLTAGGNALTISGTAYTALPSGSDIAVVANGQTTILKLDSWSEDPRAVSAYIVEGSATIAAGGAVAIISGRTYSALPSGAGVLVLEDGRSSTVSAEIVEWTTRLSTTTRVPGEDDAVAPYEGSAFALVQKDCALSHAIAVAVLATLMILFT